MGVDAKAVIEGAVTVDLTVNPDFSQVESDEPQVTINQRFEVFFPEKRPFFIENAGYFETPENLFFSRRIVDPKSAARVTGKAAGWVFGGLLVNDEHAGQAVTGGNGPRDDKRRRASASCACNASSPASRTSAASSPTASGAHESNRVYGVDGRWKIDDNWSVLGQWVGSRTVDVDGHLQIRAAR